jgi:hypothetical protein
MADKWYTAASGNWSTAANWNGGTLPTAADDVFADGKAVVIDQNVTVLSIRNTLRSGGTVGGSFTINTGGFTVICTGLGIVSGAVSCFTISAASGTTTINAGTISAGGATGAVGIAITGASIVNITANINAGANSDSHGCNITAAANVTIIGNISAVGGASAHGLRITAAATVTITGNVTGGTGTGAGINNTTVAATINITGNVTGQVSAGISSNQNSTINITGNCTAAATQGAIVTTSSNLVTVVGTITASNLSVGINVLSCTISTPCLNASNGVNAVYSGNVKIYASAVASWLYKDELNNNKFLYSAGVALGNPLEADVRDATVYGASNELTGTMIVPSPSDVRISVPTDNTVGTGELTAADFLAAIAASSDPIAVRLNNVSTVDTSGAQIASYNV